eukprot:TRINITY_DN6877_c0_g1_i2.p1 TRINITY_DN6877_c0_g1~~TRINITY_DN6877_c0_g1_i2.p1  ORF type:complete len:122 (+),score=11.22 TRINITY_DN6877_c0_g1_i2:62-427(+)
MLEVEELWGEVGKWLTAAQVCTAQRVCKQWRAAFTQPTLWHALLLRDWPSMPITEDLSWIENYKHAASFEWILNGLPTESMFPEIRLEIKHTKVANANRRCSVVSKQVLALGSTHYVEITT